MRWFLQLALWGLSALAVRGAEANLAPLARVLASSELGAYAARFLSDGRRGTQRGLDYWNDGTKGVFPDTVILTFDVPRRVRVVRVQPPVMDIDGPHRLEAVEVAGLTAAGWQPLGAPGTLEGGTTAAACRDLEVALETPLDILALSVIFTAGNRDGWAFCGEIVMLGESRLEDPPAPPPAAAAKEVVPMGFEESVRWLEQEAKRLVRACRREMNDGTAAFPPQVGIGYDAFWLRDYSYMLEGCPEAFSAKELADACRVFVRAMSPTGDGVDCVRYNGTPIYKPGYGSMGENPVADGGPFTINVAWATWRATNDKALLSEVVDRLVACLAAVPRNPANGLVHIRPDRPYDRCPYGFTDTVRKTGDELFTSLLFVQAASRLAEMLEAMGRGPDAAAWRERAARATASCRSVFWDAEAGLFRAATVRCREHDLWGSAFAVHLGVATPEQAKAIATTLRQHFAGICQQGQFRHLLPGVVWEQACEPGTYQNGGFWGTPAGWFVQTLDLVDPALARQTVVDLVTDYRRRGVGEWVLGDHVQLPGYVASATLPLQGIRAMLARGK